MGYLVVVALELVCCYYHNIQQKQVEMQQKDALKDVIVHIFT